MKWQRDLDGVLGRLVKGEWMPEPISEIWVNRCWTCRFTRDRTFGSVTCTVTGRKRSPCSECDVP